MSRADKWDLPVRLYTVLDLQVDAVLCEVNQTAQFYGFTVFHLLVLIEASGRSGRLIKPRLWRELIQ